MGEHLTPGPARTSSARMMLTLGALKEPPWAFNVHAEIVTTIVGGVHSPMTPHTYTSP